MLQAASLALERLIWIVKCHQECCGEQFSSMEAPVTTVSFGP